MSNEGGELTPREVLLIELNDLMSRIGSAIDSLKTQARSEEDFRKINELINRKNDILLERPAESELQIELIRRQIAALKELLSEIQNFFPH